MALIVPYQSQGVIQTASGGQAAQYRNASDFITPGQESLGRGLQQLASGMSKLSSVIFDAEIQKRREQMELTLLEDIQNFQMESQAWSENYQKNFQGKDAVNAEADAQAFYKKKVDALRQRWNGNSYAQRSLQREIGGVITSGIDSMRDYGNKQQEAWKDSFFAGEMTRYKDVLSNPSSTQEQIQAANQNISRRYIPYLKSKGLDEPTARVQIDNAFRDATVVRFEQGYLQSLAAGDLETAKQYLDAMKTGSTPKFPAQPRKAQLPKDIEEPALSEETNKSVQRTLGANRNTNSETNENTSVPLDITPEKIVQFERMYQIAKRENLKTSSISRYGEQFPDNPGKAARAALQDPELAQDPQTQRSVVEYFDWQSFQQESAQKQAQIEQLDKSYQSLSAAAEKKNFPEMKRIIMEASPENMPKLQSFANRIVNGDGVISDSVAFDEMVARINAGQPVQIDAEYGSSLSLQDLQRGKDMVARRDLAEFRVQEKKAFEREARKYQPWMKSKDISELYSQFEKDLAEMGDKDPAQRKKSLKAFWRTITVDKPWRFSTTIRGFQEKEYAARGYYPSEGEEYQELVAKAKAAIKKQHGVDREPTENELILLYQEVKRVNKKGAK